MLEIQDPSFHRPLTPTDFKYWPQRRLDSYIPDHAKKTPNKMAVIDPWRRVTYKELNDMIIRLAIKLKEIGIKKNSVVMYQLPNILEAVIVYHATLRIGAVSLPVTPIYREGELNEILKQVTPDIVFIPGSFRSRDYISMYQRINSFKEIPIVAVNIPDEPFMSNRECFLWEDFIKDSVGDDLFPLEFDPYEYSMLMFTSGTTSSPKGVLHTHATLGYAALTIDGKEFTDESSVFFVPSPVTHLTGVVLGLLSPLNMGSSIVLMPIWDASKAYEYISKEKCTYLMAATPFLSQIVEELKKRNERLESLRYFACGGADIPKILLQEAQERIPNCIFTRVYGSTEVPGISKFKTGFNPEKRLSHDGRCSFPTQCRIRKGTKLPDGSGELEVYGPQLFMRYIKWEETKEALNDHWFQTGDLGVIDEENFISIKGRAKDIIIRGGENFSAREVEDILISHHSIKEVAVVGIKEEVMGERACAFVVLKENSHPIKLKDLTELLEMRKIAKQKWPEKLVILDNFPYTASGKVQKFLLRNLVTW